MNAMNRMARLFMFNVAAVMLALGMTGSSARAVIPGWCKVGGVFCCFGAAGALGAWCAGAFENIPALCCGGGCPTNPSIGGCVSPNSQCNANNGSAGANCLCTLGRSGNCECKPRTIN